MIDIINTTVHNLTRVISEYYSHELGDEKAIAYEFKGFVWFQGWSDRGAQKRYEYANNLAHLIRDLRGFLQTPYP